MKRKAIYIAASVVILGVAIVVVAPMFTRRARASQTEAAATVQPVAVVLVQRKPISNSLVLSGEFVPFQEVDVHAKVAGYIRKIYVDVGDHVKAGQTVAVLEVPELNAQLQGAEAAVRRAKDAIARAKGDLGRSESLHAATHLDYKRLQQASEARPGLIAEQELDDAQAKDKEGEAQISASQAALSEAQNQLDVSVADRARLSALEDYTRIVAPFDGVITRRYVDTGSLVQAGTSSNTQALPVVSVAQNDLFRLTVPVPESAVPDIRLGSTVKVHVSALNRDFDGKVSRFADAVNQDTRTMHTEIDVHNKKGQLFAGMYADVTLTLEHENSVLAVPIQAVTRNGDQASVMVVNPEDRIEERQVKLGLEGTSEVEVISGLSANEKVIVGSRGEFRNGDLVEPRLVAQNQEDKF
ncbi:MAG TPA: efflux RND transporter periplasmic adaptor subunit [Terriglobales bacterium]